MKHLLAVLAFDILTFVGDNIAVPIAGGIGAGINWVFNKRKNNADAKTVELSNDAQIIAKWMQWGEKMEREVAELQAELRQQKIDCAKETQEMQKQISQHEKRIIELERENSELKRRP